MARVLNFKSIAIMACLITFTINAEERIHPCPESCFTQSEEQDIKQIVTLIQELKTLLNFQCPLCPIPSLVQLLEDARREAALQGIYLDDKVFEALKSEFERYDKGEAFYVRQR